MRLTFIAAALAGLVVGLAIVIVRLPSSDAPEQLDPVVEIRPPAETAEAFADAWEAGDRERIRSLLDAVSLADHSLEDLDSAYSLFDRELTVQERSIEVESVDEAGAVLRVQLQTAYFGTLEYAIDLTLTLEGEVYRARWSENVIHPSLGPGESFRSVIQRPTRGAIVDRHGIILAETRDIKMVGLNRSIIGDREGVASVLSEFGFSAGQIEAAFDSGLGDNQRVPVGPVPDDQVETALEATETVDGVLVYFREQRVHPLGETTAHAVGYTRELTAEELVARAGQGFRIGDRVGAIGLEAAMESTLAGDIGAELRIVDRAGETIEVLAERSFRDGEDVHTTLDAAVQAATFARMEDRPGAAVVLDPQTNELLALVSVPSFDPDAFERNDGAILQEILSDERGPLNNRATMGVYSAGSTFKLITGAAGLDAGVVGTFEQIFCGAFWTGLDPPRRNWEGTQGLLTIAEGLMRSCNPVFYEIGLRLYNETDGQLSEMARRFGFGSVTGQDLLPESPGLVPDAEWKAAETGELWFPGDEVNLSIGQGDLLVTPIQLANA